MVALFFKKKNLVCTMNWNHSDVGMPSLEYEVEIESTFIG